MDIRQQQEQGDVDVMEVPEIHGDLLMELLDASLAAEDDAGQHQQLADGLVADVDVDGDGDGGWIDSEVNYDIHTHQDCEDCGLDGGILLPDFDEYYGGARRLRSLAPYVVFDHDDTLEWAETAAAAAMAMDPFTSECTGDWYMDGLVMAMEWEEQEEQDAAGSGFPFEPSCYGDGGEAGAEQVYANPLWE